jgi:hypothetical protein
LIFCKKNLEGSKAWGLGLRPSGYNPTSRVHGFSAAAGVKAASLIDKRRIKKANIE